MIGLRFNKWTIVSIHPIKKRFAFCKCDCGNERLIWLKELERGLSKGCRNCRNERYKNGSPIKLTIHGMSKTNTYKVWSGLISRCENPKVRIYKYYGGRGIKVCEEWRSDFMNFFRDMGERPEGLQLDRINNNLGYSKDNCRWVTSKENNAYNKGDIPDDMPGKRFGKWLVIKLVTHSPGHRYYICVCDCGAELIKSGGDLRSGKSKQCRRCAQKAHSIIHAGWNKRKKS